jgi:hypothetical protein
MAQNANGLEWIDPAALPGFHTLWDITEESFRTLLQARFKRPPAPDITDADVELVTDTSDFVPGADHVMTRTAEIAAPVEDVWPWLSQLMRGGGFYGWRLLEKPGCFSAEYLLPDLREPRVGDRVGGLLELAAVEPHRRLVWRARGPVRFLDATISVLNLSYLLASADGERTRLVIRTHGACVGTTRPIAHYVFEALDFILAAHQAVRLKNCVERTRSREPDTTATAGGRARHQHGAFEPAR